MTIEDTSRRDPLVHLLGAMSEGPDGYVEGMEAAGMRQLLAGELLPTAMTPADEDEWSALGFTFGEPVADDPLFRRATLPAGWGRVASDRPRYGYIVDERGVRRAEIFYKAAFYDRRADMILLCAG